MRGRGLPFILVSALVAGGCSKSAPTFSVLDQAAIPQPTFGGQTAKSVAVATPGTATALRGECDTRIRAIRVTIVGVSTSAPLDSIGVGGATVTCATDGQFAFTLKPLDLLIPGVQGNQAYRIELRGETTGGLSNPTLLTVTYTKELAERWRLTSGGAESGTSARGLASSGGNFRADLRLTHFVNAADANSGPAQTTATSAHFQLRYGRAAQAH